MRIAYFIALAMALVSLTTGVQAQTLYSCTVNGRTYPSTQPCPNSNIVYYGPAPTRPSYEPPPPRISPAPANLQYLSPRCASLNDALRTASTRGLKYDTISQMQREYSQQCAEDESEANAKMREERKDNKAKVTEAKEAEKLNKERTLIQQQQCGESKRILYNKRARTDLTDGEKADLRRFEENYLSRCS